MEEEFLLLNAAKKKNRAALVKIFEFYAPRLYNYALRLCRDPLLADNIVGDVFARLVEQLAAGSGPNSNLRSYLYQTAYHLIIDEARASHRRAPLDVLTARQQDGRSVLQGSEAQILFEKVLDVIQHDLSDDQRHVIVLRFMEEFSLRETAAILGKNENHIKVIQSRALAKLRKTLEHNEIMAAISLPGVNGLSNALRPQEPGGISS